MTFQRLVCRLNHRGVRRKTKVIVGAEVYNLLASAYPNIGALRTGNDAFAFVKTGLFNGREFVL